MFTRFVSTRILIRERTSDPCDLVHHCSIGMTRAVNVLVRLGEEETMWFIMEASCSKASNFILAKLLHPPQEESNNHKGICFTGDIHAASTWSKMSARLFMPDQLPNVFRPLLGELKMQRSGVRSLPKMMHCGSRYCWELRIHRSPQELLCCWPPSGRLRTRSESEVLEQLWL